VNEFWFTPKLKGYGAVPTTWEGYTLVVVFASMVFICAVVMIRREKTLSTLPLPMVVVAVSTITFLFLCAWKTDGAWG
jgi:dolichyl-phosphate-mannose--protein O-mannosyl transferase